MKAKAAVALIILASFAPPEAQAADPPPLPVALRVSCKIENARNTAVSFFTRSLREIGNISVVDPKDAHAVSLDVAILPGKTVGRTLTGYLRGPSCFIGTTQSPSHDYQTSGHSPQA